MKSSKKRVRKEEKDVRRKKRSKEGEKTGRRRRGVRGVK